MGKMYTSYGLLCGIVIYKVELNIHPGQLSVKCEWNLGELKILNRERRPVQNEIFNKLAQSAVWFIIHMVHWVGDFFMSV